METKYVLFLVSDPVDVILTQMVFNQSNVRNELSIVSSPEQALKFIRKQPPYQQEQMPDLIVMDLNDGFVNQSAFLEEIKKSPEFRRIPVIVFTLHMLEEEVSKLYDLGANCCIRKPIDLEEFTGVVENLERFWLSSVKFQSRTSRIAGKI